MHLWHGTAFHLAESYEWNILENESDEAHTSAKAKKSSFMVDNFWIEVFVFHSLDASSSFLNRRSASCVVRALIFVVLSFIVLHYEFLFELSVWRSAHFFFHSLWILRSFFVLLLLVVHNFKAAFKAYFHWKPTILHSVLIIIKANCKKIHFRHFEHQSSAK